MTETSGTLRRSVRLFALRSGPLTRPSDRLQALARLLVLGAVLASIPIAVTLSVATYGSVHARETAAARDTRPATATLLADARVRRDRSGIDDAAPRAAVTWTTSSGGHGRAVVMVRSGVTAGSTVRIWIDPRGAVSTRPPGQGDAAALALGVGLLTVLGGACLVAAVYLLFRTVVDRRRMRGWAAGWAAVEPVWSGDLC
jgi:hypothetical protein